MKEMTFLFSLLSIAIIAAVPSTLRTNPTRIPSTEPTGQLPVRIVEKFHDKYGSAQNVDICEFDASKEQFFAISATPKGVSKYFYSADTWLPIRPDENVVLSSNWQWSLAAFIVNPITGTFSTQDYLVAAVQPIASGTNWRKGLYLIQNDQLPNPEDPPICGGANNDCTSSGHDYKGIHRDLTNGCIFYVYWNDLDGDKKKSEFQRLSLKNNGCSIAVTLVSDDLSLPTYLRVVDFLQEINDNRYTQRITIEIESGDNPKAIPQDYTRNFNPDQASWTPWIEAPVPFTATAGK